MMLCFVAMGLFVACDKEEQNSNDDAVTIVGEWRCVSYFESGTTYTSSDVWEFKADNTMTIETGGVVNSGTYTFDGSVLVITFSYGPVTYNVNELTISSMELQQGGSTGRILKFVR